MKENSDARIAEKILQFTDLGNKQVLEVGCGNGRITSFLVGKPKKLIAIEPDAEEIKEARKKVSGADFLTGSGEYLEFSDERFDMVIFTLSLHHQDSSKAIREATRVLKDNGEILIIEPVNAGEVEQVFGLVHDENQATLEAQQSIRKSGLRIERSEIFTASWIFDNKEELCQSIFAYYDRPFDADTAERIVDRLGAKSGDHPIELQDMMVIHSLKKG